MEANEKGKTTGVQVLRDVAKDRPVAFMTAVGNLVPKDFQVNLGAGEGFKALWQALATGKLPQPTETDDDA